MPAIDDFPHHGEHLANDDNLAEMTTVLLSIFVSACALFVLVVAIATM
jgi:hypothetical protein